MPRFSAGDIPGPNVVSTDIGGTNFLPGPVMNGRFSKPGTATALPVGPPREAPSVPTCARSGVNGASAGMKGATFWIIGIALRTTRLSDLAILEKKPMSVSALQHYAIQSRSIQSNCTGDFVLLLKHLRRL